MNSAVLQASPQELAQAELARRELARRNLLDFTRYTKPDYQINWHHRVLCQYLDRWVAGDIKRLIVEMPPRHGKSELVSRRLPAYLLGRFPDDEVMATSYGADLARRFNRDVQRVIDDPLYGKLFPNTALNSSNVRTTAQGTWLRNADIFEIVDHRGVYKSAGVGGGIAGMGYKWGIIDDPVKDAKDANSATIRQSTWEWYTDVFWTRQAKDAAILLTMTRYNMDDLSGRIQAMMTQIDGEQWVILRLPAILESEAERHPDDPRDIGEALWKDRYPLSFLDKARAQNSYSFAALFQQKPIPHGEAIFNTDQIEIIDYTPTSHNIVRFYDLAVTVKKHSDYTAGVKLGVTENEDFIIYHMYRVQKKMPDVEKDIALNASLDGASVRIRLEAEKAGIVQLDYLLRRADMRPYTIDAKPPEGDKYTRAQPFATRVNNGKVKMIRGEWNRLLIDELATFPLGAHDDQVDALSGAYAMLSTRRTYTPVISNFLKD